MSFAKTGFEHNREFFDQETLGWFEGAIAHLFRIQFDKIGDYKGEDRDLLAICERMEEKDKDALYQVQKLLPKSQCVRELFNYAFTSHCARLLKCSVGELLVDGPGLLINRPNTTRLLYKWHSEAHYYPKRRRFLNIWFPVFADKTKDNGVMSVKLGSHKRDWPFVEYQEGPNAFRQFEIPENFVTEFQEHTCESKRGDLIIFDRNLVHRSNPNRSDKYSFACVVRVWTPEDDLTLAGDFEVTPYGGDKGGRANLVVNP